MTDRRTPPCDDEARDLFRKYSIALKLWSHRFNTAEIARTPQRARTHRVPVDLALAGIEPDGGDMSKPRKSARIGDTERVAVPIARRRSRETDHIVRIVERARDAAIAQREVKKP